MTKGFLYEQVESEILKKIRTQQILPGEKIGTTKQLAAKYKVSTITINTALHNLSQNGYITRIPRIGNVVNDEQAWNPGNGTTSRTKIIGAIVFDSSSPYLWAKALKGIETALRDHSYHLVIGNDEGNIDKAINYIVDLSEKGIEGFIIVPIGKENKDKYEEENARLIQCVEQTGLPYVLFHRGLALNNTGTVSIDNYNDTKRLMELFLKAGVINPICISHYYDTVVHDRERAFLDTLRDAGIPDPEKRILHTIPQSQNIIADSNPVIKEFVKSHDIVDGIFTLSGNLLQAAMSSLDINQINNIQFATFDYSDSLYDHNSVKLIMIPPAFEMGQQAAEMILTKINDKNNITSHILLPSKLLSKL